MTDRELMEDMLTLQKLTDVNYSMFANECSTESMRTDVLNILSDEHKIQAEVFDQMEAYCWYSPADAEMQKIEQAKQKFSQMN